MRLVSKEEYIEVSALIKTEMRELARHEKKNSYMAQFAINNCYVRHLPDNSLLFQIFSPGFIRIIEHDYINALIDTPECFGTGDARDVVHGKKGIGQKYLKHLLCILISNLLSIFIVKIIAMSLLLTL